MERWLWGVLHIWGGGANGAFRGGHHEASRFPAGLTGEVDALTMTAVGRENQKWFRKDLWALLSLI